MSRETGIEVLLNEVKEEARNYREEEERLVSEEHAIRLERTRINKLAQEKESLHSRLIQVQSNVAYAIKEASGAFDGDAR